MSPRATNLALFAAVPALVMTGLVAWALPLDGGTFLLVVHRASAAALIVVLAWKEGLARRSVRRRAATGRASTLAIGGLATVALLLTLGLGLAWTIGLVSYDRPFGYSLMNVHVFAGVLLVPLVVAHAAQRRASASTRAPFARRDVLRGVAAMAGGVVLAAALDRIDPTRRTTGSRDVPALPGGSFPVTSWTFDAVPPIALADFRLLVDGETRMSLSVAQLSAMAQEERDATLDCTSGWASSQRWRGVAVRTLVEAGRRVRVTSVTGHTATFAPNEIDELLLATHVGGVTLPPEHGAPVRLVAPMHRGFMWVKWVARIEVI